MSLRAIVTVLVRVTTTSSPTTQEFLAKNGFEEEEKENEGGNENMKGYVRKLNGFLSMNLPNPKGESFDTTELKEEDQKSQV